jgi:hypothetical protein
MVMNFLRRFSCLGSFMFAFTSFSSPQALPSATELPTEETAKSWLLSGDPQKVAWGAHDTVVARYRNLITDLLSVASKWQPLPGRNLHHPRPLDLSPQQIDDQDAMQAEQAMCVTPGKQMTRKATLNISLSRRAKTLAT